MKRILHRLWQTPSARVAMVLLGILLIAALTAPVLAPRDPFTMHDGAALQAPSSDFWLGTDRFGRDQLSRLLYGSRMSFQVGVIAVGVALICGTTLGVLAGYFRGVADAVISRCMDVLFAFPEILLALAVMAVLGAGTGNLMLAIGIVYTPIFARIARGAVLEVNAREHVEAARSMGAGHLQILLRHILPNIAPPLIVQTTLSFAFAVLAEAALSFLGLGVEPDAPSWGIMLKEGKDWMLQAWWVAVFPGLAITLAVLNFNLLGDALRDALDPRLHREDT
jgi:peptide/nickel transport system permease protein